LTTVVDHPSIDWTRKLFDRLGRSIFHLRSLFQTQTRFFFRFAAAR